MTFNLISVVDDNTCRVTSVHLIMLYGNLPKRLWNQHNYKKWRADYVTELFHYTNFKQALRQLSVIDCNVSIIALTTLTHNNSNQTHYYRCTLHPSLFPVVFSHSLSLFQASSPPELRVIGSDISMPASHSTNAAKHKKAQCMDNHAHCCTHTHTSWENTYIHTA